MDEVFWSNVVKRWSDASENVISLKKELAQVQEERALYRSLVHSIRRDDVKDLRHPEHILEEHTLPSKVPQHDEDADTTIKDELQDAEAGLYRAKEEYKRLQQELATSLQQVKTLTQEKEKLSLAHEHEMDKLRQEMKNMLVKQRQAPDDHPLRKDVATNEHDSKAKTVIAALERQVEKLAQSVKEYEVENEDLRDALSVTQDKLQKADENSKGLLASIVKLQDIARHSGILRPVSNLSQYSDSRRSSRKLSISSANDTMSRDVINSIAVKRPTKSNFILPTPQIDDETVIEKSASELASSLPAERQIMIDNFSSTVVPVIDSIKNQFDREFLKVALGEDVQSLLKYLPDNRTDKKTIASSYLCPTLSHHPWCPSSPGQHGFIFVGLGKEKDTYKFSTTRNLFVGLPKDRTKGRTFRYLGKYKVSRVDPLSVEEWNTLPPDAKQMYAKLTKDKTHDARSTENIILAYDAGEIFVPCVQLQFLTFDELIYSALLSYRTSIRTRLKDDQLLQPIGALLSDQLTFG